MSSGPEANILLVDDRPENLASLEAMLADLGQNLVRAQSGEEALRQLLEHVPDYFAVILMDVRMPGMDGLETAETIRSRKSLRDTPIIFVTAHSDNEAELAKAYALGAVDFIFKPVVPEILKAKVSVFVELLKKTEQVKEQAEQLRQLEEKERRERELLSLDRLSSQDDSRSATEP